MKKILYSLLLCIVPFLANAQTWPGIGTPLTQRNISGSDTTYRLSQGSFGYIYFKSLFGVKKLITDGVNSITASNGLTRSVNDIKLGGQLTGFTDLYTFNYNLSIYGRTSGNTNAHGYLSIMPSTSIIGMRELVTGTTYRNININFTKGAGVNDGTAIIKDDFQGIGLQYFADYSSTFINESLVSKRYVDAKVVTGSASNLTLGIGTSTTQPVNNSNGTGFTLPSVTTSIAGLMSATDKVKLNAISGTNTGDQTLSMADGGSITISGANGNNIILGSLNRMPTSFTSDANTPNSTVGFYPYGSSSTAINYPVASVTGGGFEFFRDANSFLNYFEFWKQSSATDALYFRTGLDAATANAWDIVAGRNWTANNYSPLTGGSNYIQNQNVSPQTGTFNITGAGTIGGALTTAGMTSSGSVTINNTFGAGSGTAGNLSASGVTNATGATGSVNQSRFLFGGASNIQNRVTMGGTLSTVMLANNNYANTIIGSAPITEGTSGTHAIFANLVVKSLGAVTNGTATLTNTASLYIDGASNAGINNYSLWVASGASNFGGDIMQVNTPVGTAGTDSLVVKNASTDIYSRIAANYYAVDANVLHLSGTQTVTGTKTFSTPVFMDNVYTTNQVSAAYLGLDLYASDPAGTAAADPTNRLWSTPGSIYAALRFKASSSAIIGANQITDLAFSSTIYQNIKFPDATGTILLDTTGPLGGTFSSTGTATTTFTVTIGQIMVNNTYKVAQPGARNVLSSALCYITNKTTTTFDVVYMTGLTGSVSFDWVIVP